VSQAHPVRVLVVGDPYMPAGAFASALAGLGETAVVLLGRSGDRHPLLDLPNVVITPHIGGAAHETLRRRAQMAAGEVARLVAGQFPDHLLNPEIAAHKEAAS
jgi:lactate dehydrogenase-like 2-hydroxyacid dehydrogenase